MHFRISKAHLDRVRRCPRTSCRHFHLLSGLLSALKYSSCFVVFCTRLRVVWRVFGEEGVVGELEGVEVPPRGRVQGSGRIFQRVRPAWFVYPVSLWTRSSDWFCCTFRSPFPVSRRRTPLTPFNAPGSAVDASAEQKTHRQDQDGNSSSRRVEASVTRQRALIWLDVDPS